MPSFAILLLDLDYTYMITQFLHFTIYKTTFQVLSLFSLIENIYLLLQSGKSAAIYACAKEKGFQVIEVLLK